MFLLSFIIGLHQLVGVSTRTTNQSMSHFYFHKIFKQPKALGLLEPVKCRSLQEFWRQQCFGLLQPGSAPGPYRYQRSRRRLGNSPGQQGGCPNKTGEVHVSAKVFSQFFECNTKLFLSIKKHVDFLCRAIHFVLSLSLFPSLSLSDFLTSVSHSFPLSSVFS